MAFIWQIYRSAAMMAQWPAGFDPSADYYVIRQSDGMMEVLNATLVGSPDADPLTYEVVSPHGLSTFSMVKAESVLAHRRPDRCSDGDARAHARTGGPDRLPGNSRRLRHRCRSRNGHAGHVPVGSAAGKPRGLPATFLSDIIYCRQPGKYSVSINKIISHILQTLFRIHC